MKKILVLSANPVDTSRLRLDEEVREIQEALKRSNSRDEFEIVSLVALRVADLRRGLLDHSPSIIHFSGHGESQGLILENDVGQKQLVDKEALAQLFSLFSSIECVLLNACYSEAQAEEIYQHVNCVIGMSQAIGDRAAINFAVGFYDALGGGCSYQKCFDVARNAIGLAGILEESATPRIKIRQDHEQAIDVVDQDLPCPYKGLSPFRTEDAQFFYGRDVFVEELFAATKTRNFIPILGDSGSGKSSVVFAGLVPRLQKTDRWIVIEFRPDKEPFHSLAWSLMPFYANSVDSEQLAESRRLSDYLQNGEVSLADVLKRIQENHPQDRVLLIADQFEEIYTLCGDEKVYRKFLDVLLAGFQSSASWQTSPILVATMRIDFYGNVLSYSFSADAFRNSDIKIRSMNRDELKDVIEKPANQMGVNFESGLIDRILDEVENKTGNLPLLEFALAELWRQQVDRLLTHQAYQAITYDTTEQFEGKGFERALASYADDEYQKFSYDDQEQIRQIFAQLVQPGEGKEDTKRLATQGELGEISWDLVTKLATARLVVTSQNADGQNTVEIVHEALIQRWGSLRQWIEADRVFRAWQERLRGLMAQWIKVDRDDGSLLRGAALVEAKGMLTVRGCDLGAEQEFIELSIKEYEQQNKWQDEQSKREIKVYKTFALICFFSVIGSILYTVSMWQAIQKKDFEEARMLGQYAANQSRSGQKLDAMLSVIKAGKTLKRQNTHDSTVLTLLNKSIQEVREKNRLVGHEGSINSLIFSPDNKIIASAGQDKVIRFWNQEGKLLNELRGHKKAINKIVFSPDGQIIASVSQDKTIRLWSVKGNLLSILQGHQHEVFYVSFNNDNKTITSIDTGETVKRWSIDGKLLQTLQDKSDSIFYNANVTVSPDGKTIASVDFMTGIKLWDIHGELLRTFKGHQNGISSMMFSPNGRFLASTGLDKNVKLWSIDSKISYTLKGHHHEVSSVVFSSNGNFIASHDLDGVIKIWSTNGKIISTIKGRHDKVSFSSDSKHIITNSNDRIIRIWKTNGELEQEFDRNSSRISRVILSSDNMTIAFVSDFNTIKLLSRKGSNVFKSHQDDVSVVAFSPTASTVISASYDKTIKLWNRKEKLLQTIQNDERIKILSYSPNGKMIVTNGKENTIKLWSIDGDLLSTMRGHSTSINNILFSPNGENIASVSDDKVINLWDIHGKLINTFQNNENKFNSIALLHSIAFSPDSKMIAYAVNDGNDIFPKYDHNIKIWNVHGNLEHVLKGHRGGVNSLSFSPDGQTIVSGSSDATIKVWDISGELKYTFSDQEGSISKILFSPDGKMTASISDGKSIKLRDNNGELLKTIEGNQGSTIKILFSPDSKIVAFTSHDSIPSVNDDNAIKVRNTYGEELVVLDGHQSWINSIAFSPDSKFLASGSSDKTVRLWHLNLDSAMVDACDWTKDYLKNSQDIEEESDRRICDDIKRSN